MAVQIPKLSDDLDFISKLGDNPNTDNGMSSADLKAQFDKAPNIIKKFINEYVVPAINNYVVGSGFLPLMGGTMKGNIAMGDKKVTGLGAPADSGDAVNKEYADKLVPKIIPITRGGTNADTAEKARENLGAASAQHSHKAADITEAIPMSGGGTGAQNGSDGLANLLAAGYMRMSSYQIVASVDNIPADAPEGAIFFVPMEE
jgi:hypothetical protein